ncbi:hypothetical protein HNQ51_002301 [Inhella inkyongensis]|uniref:Uncharacterized protein n=1 Tax=Inhella inkyongensis TaxID=392593 RepID=A0A840S5X8_9BURK|nr:hypothetical protein [Inhella inkyongensis]MBB5204982.1 hypothetical protein [Inhella inkyongensis]
MPRLLYAAGGGFTQSPDNTLELRMKLRTIALIGAATLPNVSLAMGGEGTAEGLLKAAGILFVWIVATIISFFGKRRLFGGAWFLAWAVRLSLPTAILWEIYVTPVLHKQEQRQQAQVRSEHQAAFEAACKNHATNATHILRVESTERPKTIYVDEPDELFGPKISQRLVDCTQSRTPVCRELGLDTVEWAWKHSSGFSPCKVGADPARPGQCLPEFNRTDFGAERIKVTPIEKPKSQYIIRVADSKRTFKANEIRRYHVTLESLQTAQVLASTELLMSWVAPPCQNFEAEVANMLTRSFSAR